MNELAELLNGARYIHQTAPSVPVSLATHVRNKFKVSITSLSEVRANDDIGMVFLRYHLPLQNSSWMDSNIFELFSDIKAYTRVSLKGAHNFVLPSSKQSSSLGELFNDNTIAFELRRAEND